MRPREDDGRFVLESDPGQLWDVTRMARELRADDQTIRRWVREGKLPEPRVSIA